MPLPCLMPLRDRLIAAANPDGGWPYYAGKVSRLEPTSWALIALAAVAGPTRSAAIERQEGPASRLRDASARGAIAQSAEAPAGLALGRAEARPSDGALARHLEFLRGQRDASGALRDPGSPSANLAWNGLALLALSALDLDADPLVRDVAAAVVAAKGVRLAHDRSGSVSQNNQLQAWAWTAGTFSWVEPTAYCLLALKRRPGPRAADVDARIREAESMLLDRVCPHGGWNYGNSAVLFQDLRPYVPTTALALLAMQDRATEPQVRLSLDWLSANATSEQSAMALSLAAVCLSVYRLPSRPVVAALRTQAEATGFLDNTHLIAMAQYALTIDDHDAAAFRVASGKRRAA